MAKFFRIGTYGAVNIDKVKAIACYYTCEMGKGFESMRAGDIRFLKTDEYTDESGHFHRAEYAFAYQISTNHARKVTVFFQPVACLILELTDGDVLLVPAYDNSEDSPYGGYAQRLCRELGLDFLESLD